MKRPLAAIAFLLALLGGAHGTEYHVSGIGDDTLGDGSAGDPWRTITRALESAGDGDIIRVHEGDYGEAAGELFPIRMKPGVHVAGGDPALSVVAGVANQPVFLFPGDQIFPPSSVVEGLTITGGEIGVAMDLDSDAVSLDSEPTVSRNIIVGNVLQGILATSRNWRFDLHPRIVGNYVADNGRGGIRIHEGYESMSYLVGNVITRNRYGSGIHIDARYGSPVLSRNMVHGNMGAGIGAIVSCYGHSRPVVTNNLVHGNSYAGLVLAGHWGLFGCDGAVTAEVAGNTIAYNGGYGLDSYGYGLITIRNTIVWGHSTDLVMDTYWGIGSDVAYSTFLTSSGIGLGGPGNLSTDPLFVDPGTGDFHLSPLSPCIDAGTSDDAPASDLEDFPRLDVLTVPNTGGGAEPWYDMGAFEFVGTEDQDADTWPDLIDCAPLDGSVWAPPEEVRDLRLSRSPDGEVLQWGPTATGGVPGSAFYDVASGILSELAADASFDRAGCLAGDLAAESHLDDRGGASRYYLVRAQNACPEGEGTFGSAPIAPDPRDQLDDPAVSPVQPCP